MTCPACGGTALEPVHERDGVPVHSCLLVADRQRALSFPRGDLRIVACRECGFVHNAAYDPAMSHYSADYEETQGFSPHFREFLAGLAARWVERHRLQGTRVVEIGCGKAEFHVELLRHGVAEAVGVDPGVKPDRIPEDLRDRLTLVPGFFPRDLTELDAAAVVCRHTLEHIGPVADFMRQVRTAIGDRTDTAVLFELPGTLHVLREAAFWDVYYEHCSYFTLGSLSRLFRRTGFEVLDLAPAYDDQYLLVEARPVPTGEGPGEPHPAEEPVPVVLGAAASFRASVDRTVTAWADEVRAVAARGGRTVIWGSGSKGVAFLAALGEDAAEVACAVDINPYKHGRFMAGTGHEIVPPARLRDLRPDLVIAMNPVYVDEIQRDLDALGVQTVLKAL